MQRIHDSESVKQLVRRISERYHLPYFSLTPTFSISPEIGYLPGEHYKCPQSGKDCEVYSRVVGYLRPVAQWNDGKQAEYVMRQTYNTPKVLPMNK